MKMKLITLSALSLITNFAWGQYLLYNNGATVKIQSGATLYVEGGVHNTAMGTFDNDGTLEIKGDFLNEGTWEPTTPNTLKFSGNTASTLTSAPTVAYQDLVVQKTGANLVLASHTTVNDSLVFSSTGSGKIESAGFDMKLGPTALAGGYDSDEYVAQTGTGMMQKEVTANGSFFFPVGDAAIYSPLNAAYSGSAYASANIRTHVNNATHDDIPDDATDYLSRYWDVTATGITGYANTITGTYDVTDDLTGMASLTKGAVYDGTEWSYFDAATAGNTVTGSTQDVNADFTGTNFFGKVLVKAFLQGPYNTATGLMTTTLAANPTIEALMLNSPYVDAPASVLDIPAGVTDWVKLELRDPGAPSIILGKASAFIKSDGSIVGLDGVSPPAIKNGNPVSVLGIVHRNHLFVRTPDAGIDVVNPSLHDFTTGLDKAYDNPAISNDAMILLTAGVYGMYGGNANTSNATNLSQIKYTGLGNDPLAIIAALPGGNIGLTVSNVYHQADLNLNGNVRYTGLNNDTQIVLNALGGNIGLTRTHHQ